MCTMNSAFALVLTVFLVSGEPVDIAVSVHRTMQECMTAATEQKIPGNCYPHLEAPGIASQNSLLRTR
ncbi:DUF1482 family protein [Escherichia coli]|nr:DUF1482 family protein [Escherichia coli]